MAAPVSILYLDDYAYDRELVRDILAQEGDEFSVTEARSRREFEAKLDEEGFDIILSDFNILGFDALQVLALVKERRPGIPVLILTGSGSEETAVECLKNGAADYLIKGAKHLQKLPYAIRAVLEKARIEGERRTAEQRLRESEEDYRTLFDLMGQGVVYQDRDGRVLRANRAAAEILGLCMADLMARGQKDHADCHAVHQDGTPYPPEEYPAMVVLRTGRPVRNVIVGLHRPGQPDVAWLNVSATPLFRPGEERPFRAFTTFEDITPLVESEQAMRQSRERLRELSVHLQQVREEEKADIAREIHDELGGTLTAISVDAHWVADQLPGAAPVRERLAEILRETDKALATMRRIITDLRPTILDDLGLYSAIEWQVEEFRQRTGIDCRLSLAAEREPPKSSAIVLFRVLQEALTNVARHARASRVDVETWVSDGTVTLEISDNGCGGALEEMNQPGRHGIRGMAERLADLGGRLEVESAAGRGTVVRASLPLAAEAAR